MTHKQQGQQQQQEQQQEESTACQEEPQQQADEEQPGEQQQEGKQGEGQVGGSEASSPAQVPSCPSLLELPSALLLECVRASESAADLIVESESIRCGEMGHVFRQELVSADSSGGGE
jgi:hypothetical protein